MSIWIFFIFVTGALIEYAVILFKKQKLSKFGTPGQSAYPHTQTQLSNYMSMRRPNSKNPNPNGTSEAEIRQRNQQQQQQYDMQPITSCRYNWNQGYF